MAFKGKINGENVGWTYGLMSSHLADMTPVSIKSRSELMLAPFVAVLVLSCITFLVGMSLLIVGVRRKRRHAGVEAPFYQAKSIVWIQTEVLNIETMYYLTQIWLLLHLFVVSKTKNTFRNIFFWVELKVFA